ncbi:MAG: PDZ domain-containing protein [Planctomycetes bacterium]|nr:PDZ domain-containing protein [Planctomycetota bacterium]
METWMKKFGLVGLSLAGVVALAAGRAPDEEEEIGGSFEQPINQQGGAAQSNGHARSMSTVVDGGDTITVVTENGKTTVQRNGEKLKKSQYRIKGNQIELLDESGNVTKTIPSPAVPRVHRFSFNGAPTPPPVPGGAQTKIVVRGTPKVMLGVTMTDADAEVLEDIDADGGGVMLMSVTEGLPAAKAGLKARDVVVEADGKALAGEEALRSILKSKNPGDQLALKLFREGKAQTVNVTLEAFDASKLNVTTTVTRDSDGDAQEIEEILQGVEKQVRTQIEALKSQLSATDWNQVRDQVTAALGDAMKQLEEARKQAAEAGVTGMKWWQEHGQNIQVPHGWLQLTPTPSAPAAMPRQDVSEKLDRLSEQLDKMNKRLDAMEKQLDKK